MRGTNARVDARGWRILGEAMGYYPSTITVRMASKAVGDGMPLSAHKALIEDLVHKGLLRHVVDCGEHPLAPGCHLVISERGALARLGREVQTTVAA